MLSCSLLERWHETSTQHTLIVAWAVPTTCRRGPTCGPHNFVDLATCPSCRRAFVTQPHSAIPTNFDVYRREGRFCV